MTRTKGGGVGVRLHNNTSVCDMFCSTAFYYTMCVYCLKHLVECLFSVQLVSYCTESVIISYLPYAQLVAKLVAVESMEQVQLENKGDL